MKKVFLKNKKYYLLSKKCENCKLNRDTEKLKNNYMATLSHDLKTPTLAQIRTLELFIRGTFGEVNNSQKELLQLMLDSSLYMYSMVDTLVSSYKYENGEIILSYEEFNILELIEHCVKQLENRIKASEIKLIIKSNLLNPYINADKSQIKQVILTMLSNSINYCYDKSEIKIVLNELVDKDISKILVKVINNSPYISHETISNIFKRYVSHADKFNTVGAGLGLYLFKQIIEAHKGNIFVTSSEQNINTLGFIINK